MPYCYLNVIADVNNFYLPTPILLSGDFQNLRYLVKSLSSTFISEFEKTKGSMYLFVAPLAQVINLFEEAGFSIFSINKNEKRNIWILHKDEEKQKTVLNSENHVDIALSTEDLVIEDGMIEDCPECKRVYVRKQGDGKNKILPYRSAPLVHCSNQSQRSDQNCSYEENDYITRKKLDQDLVVNCTDTEALPAILTMMNIDENKFPENYQINYIETVPPHNDNIIFIPSTNLLNQCAVVEVSREQEHHSSASTVIGSSYDPILAEEKPIINSMPGKPLKRFLNKEICVRETSIDNNLVRMIIEKNNLPTKKSNPVPNENNMKREEKIPRLRMHNSSESIQINNQPESPGVRPKCFENLNGMPKKLINVESNKFQNDIMSRNEDDDAPTKDTKQSRIQNNYSITETDTLTESEQSKGESKFEKGSISDQSTEFEFQPAANEKFAQNFNQKVNQNESTKFNREADIDLEALKIIKKYQEKYKNVGSNISDASPSRESSYSYFDTRSHGSINSVKDVDKNENEKCDTPPSKESLKITYETLELAPGDAEILQTNHIKLDNKKPKYSIKEINQDKNNPPSRSFALNKTFKNSINDKTNKVSVKSVSAEDKNYLTLAQRRQLINTVTNQTSRKEFVNKKISNFLTYENGISRGMRFDQNNDMKSPFNAKFRVPNVKEKARSMTFSRLHTKNF